ncbi:MAG TPA: M48 family metalloprotease [Nitriliruptorales bacterium]|nr:M48 family metalloprotease [Nitriliruptorales bacterium]
MAADGTAAAVGPVGGDRRGERAGTYAAVAVLLALVGVAVNLWRPTAPPLGMPTELARFGEEVLTAVDGYRGPRRWGTLVALLAVTAVPLLAVGTVTGRRALTRLAGRRPRSARRGALIAVALTLAADVAASPVAFYLGYVQDGRYGFRTSDLGGWLRDWLVGHAPGWVLAAVAGGAFVIALARWPATWHSRAVPAVTVAAAVVVLVGPLVVEPLWLRTRPLPHGPVRAAVEEVLRRGGTGQVAVLVGDASRRTTKVNAYVSGLGPSRRVVLFDTLLQRPPAQVAAVVAHELAHRQHGDIPRGVLLTPVGVLPAAVLTRRVLATRWVQRVVGRDPADPRLVAVAAAVLAVAAVFTLPLASALSQRAEAAADHRALELTRDPGTAVEVSRLFVVRDLADPSPPAWFQATFGSHPTPAERIRTAVGFAAQAGLPLPDRDALVAAEQHLTHPRIADR